ncbi:CaiB/BaiF CoA-transferase family protein [Frondihabitans sp. PAMC 28766]|uniref:CaiB/BaiF CoA transferase family protein n=1 Tax=Frondihabitans sp. PAMC 28766 TaxID=1795630 RepID=UPI001EF3FB6A|nr:CaiB/BaiF CoA-transferase family protein [Frondihabitans sp. PAMC 28766]
MMLADHGADVVRVERPNRAAPITPAGDASEELLHRNRTSIALDLKDPGDHARALDLMRIADVVLEGFRPGVMERLGLGPDVAVESNPLLVYVRITGWGQSGPAATRVGHDLDYLAVSGTLSLLGKKNEPPAIPLALVGDFGGGGMLAAFGVLAALMERTRSGRGQVVDASILDGSALLATAFHGYRGTGAWTTEREDNLVDGGAPFYNTYTTLDGRFVAVAALEPAFYAALLRVLGLAAADLAPQDDRESWPVLRRLFADVIARRTRDDWVAASQGTEACLSPVLTLEEARLDEQIVARGTIVEFAGTPQPSPAPRFSRTAGSLRTPPTTTIRPTSDVLDDWKSDC